MVDRHPCASGPVEAPVMRLHGYAVSNYFNIVRAALIEKQAAFEIVRVRASQDEAFLAMSPLGKIPFLETPHGPLAETIPILEYLDDVMPHPSLRPENCYLRARARQTMNVVQLYIEAQVRQLFPGVFFGGLNAPATVRAVKPVLERAVGALGRLVRPDPYLFGASLTAADLFTYYCLDIAERVTTFVYGWSILSGVDGLPEWRQRIAARECCRIVDAEFRSEFKAYLEARNAAWQEPEARERHDDA